MPSHFKEFNSKAGEVARDLSHREIIRFNMAKYYSAVEIGKSCFSDLNTSRNILREKKKYIFNNWDKFLIEFEENCIQNGIEVLWASNTEEAHRHLAQIISKENIRTVVKSKSMTTEELSINEFLNSLNVESIETDLGEYIVQVAGEKPYHIVTPAMHKNKESIAELFHEKFNIPVDSTPEEMTLFVRNKLRKKFLSADAGITGANFLIADEGAIALTENEGNASLSFSLPKIHIAISGIEKLIPSMKDLPLFWTMLSSYGTGQKMTVYNSIVKGSDNTSVDQGHKKMYLILIDNGRTKIYQDPILRSSLYCIRCGSCLNACPVYRNIGGFSYDSTYPGPIGSVITPHLNDFEKFAHLSFACTLCNSCKFECPVGIDLPKLLLYNRNLYVKSKPSYTIEKLAFRFVRIMLKRKRLDFFSPSAKNMISQPVFNFLWGKNRSPLQFQKSYSKQWFKTNSFK